MTVTRWTSRALVLGLTCGLVALVPTWAQDDEQSERRVEDVLEQFQDRLGQFQIGEEEPDSDQLREEIEELRGQLKDLNDLRMDMAIAVAEVRAQMAGQMPAGFAVPGGGAYGQFQSQAGFPGGGAGIGAQGVRQGDDEEQKERIRREALARELRQVRDQFRNEVQQAKGQASNYVQQLRSIREQQERLREQQERMREQQEQQRKQQEQQRKQQEEAEADDNDNDDNDNDS